MGNALLPKKLEKKFKKAADKAAKIKDEQDLCYRAFDHSCPDTMVREVFNSIINHGKPTHQIEAIALKQKYEEGLFGFSDVLALNNLYKTVGYNMTNKENDDE